MAGESAPPQVVELRHQAIAWIVPTIEKFPGHCRVTLGERIERELIETRPVGGNATWYRVS